MGTDITYAAQTVYDIRRPAIGAYLSAFDRACNAQYSCQHLQGAVPKESKGAIQFLSHWASMHSSCCPDPTADADWPSEPPTRSHRTLTLGFCCIDDQSWQDMLPAAYGV